MGYFADRPVTSRDEVKKRFLKDIEEKSKFHPALLGQNPNLTPTFAKEVWGIIGTTAFINDPCNVTLITKYGTFHHRNPYCQPPPPPPEPKGAYKLPVTCDCGADIGFGTHIVDDSTSEWVTAPGLDFFDYLLTGEKAPTGVVEVTQRFGLAFRQLDGQEPVYGMSGYIPGKGGLRVFYAVARVTKEDIKNGYLEIELPNHPEGHALNWGVVVVNCLGCARIPVIDPPPPPPKKKDCECMCCDGQNNDALLKLVLKRIGSLPATVPDIFTKQNPEYVNIESLAELALWQMQQLDAIAGAFPIEIEIQDSDLVEEGNQAKKVTLPNQAEAIAEILSLLLTVKRDTHATLITALKTMGEAGMTKMLATKGLDVGLANAEYLGYKLDQTRKEIPSLFTPGGNSISETLKERNIDIVTYENTDKTDLQDDLKILKTMAARWNAQNWRTVRGDGVESLKQTLFGNTQAISESGNKPHQEDFNDFTEKAERGFIEISGITDSINPWGRPFDERPKVREIGTNGGRYDKGGGIVPPATHG